MLNEINYSLMGSRIANIRREQNMKQSELAEAVDVATATISSIERGKTKTSLNKLCEIAQVLCVDVSYLLVGTNVINSVPNSIYEKLKLLDGYNLSLIENLVDHMINKSTGRDNR